MTQTPDALLLPALEIARKAGVAIMEVYNSEFAVTQKDDRSPLTQADLASHRSIVAGLRGLTPDLPIISEEAGLPPFAQRSQWQRYWLIDPLDGTKEFVKRNGEFTVNIALIEDHVPVLGVVVAPDLGVDYYGVRGEGAYRHRSDEAPERIEVAAPSDGPVRIVGSRSHRGASLDAFLEKLGEHEMVPMGSSLKFCVVAEGGADLYPRLGPTSEWDTGAAHAVVEAAGGRVIDPRGEPLRYNVREEILNPHFLVIGNDARPWLDLL